MRRVGETDETPGGDSFLDVVANIVGILVLLVVVVAVRAGQAATAEVDAPAPAGVPVEEIAAQANDLLADAHEQRQHAGELVAAALLAEAEAERRDAERAEATLYVTKLRAELDAAQENLATGNRRSFESQNAIAQAKLRLDRLTREQIALSAYEAPAEVQTVVCEPTPIVDSRASRTVSFRVKQGRLVYVPIDELTVELSKQLDAPAIRDPSKPTTTRETIGPVQGFVGDADIGWSVVSRGGRVGLQSQVLQLILREATPLRGESPDEAFAPGGYIASQLDLYDPEDVVVRLMIYADSFDDAPEIERRFRERGFRIAKSLKSNGQRLGFSTRGYKAVVQ